MDEECQMRTMKQECRGHSPTNNDVVASRVACDLPSYFREIIEVDAFKRNAVLGFLLDGAGHGEFGE